MTKKFYAVKEGRKRGIFTSWQECEAQVKGFNGAKFKGFASEKEAKAWLDGETAGATVQPLPEAPTAAADYVIYTDGSCLKNPAGPGGWAAVIINEAGDEVKELSQGFASTTNNRMELSAAIGALSAIDGSADIVLYTDSQYLKKAFTNYWLRNWQRNGWQTAAGTPVKNQDLWQELARLCQKHRVRFSWVKGHVGNKYNERCDELAKAAARKFSH